MRPRNPLAQRTGLLPRLATALVLAPLALTAVWFGGRLYAAVIAVMAVFLVFEWTRIVRGAEFGRAFYALAATSIVAAYLSAAGLHGYALLAALAGGAVATAFEWPHKTPHSWPAIGAGYIVGPAVAALWLRQMPGEGLVLTVLLFACVWGTDTGAYVVGKSVGGPKMAPSISPGKTWSGTLGGVATGALIGALIGKLGGLGEAGDWAIAGAFLAVASVAGDLSESQLKRAYGLKDSGSAFPGHGGVLDRLDGFLFAAPALALLVLLREAPL